jgi:hypothetical protein
MVKPAAEGSSYAHTAANQNISNAPTTCSCPLTAHSPHPHTADAQSGSKRRNARARASHDWRRRRRRTATARPAHFETGCLLGPPPRRAPHTVHTPARLASRQPFVCLCCSPVLPHETGGGGPTELFFAAARARLGAEARAQNPRRASRQRPDMYCPQTHTHTDTLTHTIKVSQPAACHTPRRRRRRHRAAAQPAAARRALKRASGGAAAAGAAAAGAAPNLRLPTCF